MPHFKIVGRVLDLEGAPRANAEITRFERQSLISDVVKTTAITDPSLES